MNKKDNGIAFTFSLFNDYIECFNMIRDVRVEVECDLDNHGASIIVPFFILRIKDEESSYINNINRALITYLSFNHEKLGGVCKEVSSLKLEVIDDSSEIMGNFKNSNSRIYLDKNSIFLDKRCTNEYKFIDCFNNEKNYKIFKEYFLNCSNLVFIDSAIADKLADYIKNNCSITITI